jgi:hypothetical protein
LRFDVCAPKREPMLISFPQCGHFMRSNNTRLMAILQGVFQNSPLPTCRRASLLPCK